MKNNIHSSKIVETNIENRESKLKKDKKSLDKFQKEQGFDYKIDRKEINWLRKTIGEYLGFEYLVKTVIPRENKKKTIRIICNQTVIQSSIFSIGKSNDERLDIFKENFSKIILYKEKSRGMQNFSNGYVIVTDFHKIIFSTTENKTFKSDFVHIHSVNKKLNGKEVNQSLENSHKFMETQILFFSTKHNSIDEERKKIFSINKDNLMEIMTNLHDMYTTGFIPDELIMDFKIYDSCEIDVEYWHEHPIRKNGPLITSVKKSKQIVPLVKLDKIIPVEMKTIPIKNSSFTRNQKKFFEFFQEDPKNILDPLILHIPIENLFSDKISKISEYSYNK